jgi:hypothetical protein
MRGGVLFKPGVYAVAGLAGLAGFVGVMALLGYRCAAKRKAGARGPVESTGKAKMSPEEMWQRHVETLKALQS